MIRLLAHHPPPLSLSPSSKLYVFLSLPVCRRSSFLTEEGGRGLAKNHPTARKLGPLYIIQYSLGSNHYGKGNTVHQQQTRSCSHSLTLEQTACRPPGSCLCCGRPSCWGPWRKDGRKTWRNSEANSRRIWRQDLVLGGTFRSGVNIWLMAPPRDDIAKPYHLCCLWRHFADVRSPDKLYLGDFHWLHRPPPPPPTTTTTLFPRTHSQ
jgi:hypothetical protein